MRFEPVEIGRGSSASGRLHLLPNTVLAPGTVVGPGSIVMPGVHRKANAQLQGNPARVCTRGVGGEWCPPHRAHGNSLCLEGGPYDKSLLRAPQPLPTEASYEYDTLATLEEGGEEKDSSDSDFFGSTALRAPLLRDMP